MNAVLRGTFVISWEQTEVDGIRAAPLAAIGRGAAWRWRGEALRLDGPGRVLTLGVNSADDDIRAKAAWVAGRLLGRAPRSRHADATVTGVAPPERGFTVTDGRHCYGVSILDGGTGGKLAMMSDGLPPGDTDLFVVDHAFDTGPPAAHHPEAATETWACGFTSGTFIATPDGARRVEDFRTGDLVLTKDDGPQEVLWTARRRITGARLQAMPQQRPIRIRAGALDAGPSMDDLILAPGHQVLLNGPQAMALFNVPEVLVTATDLVDCRRILIDPPRREVVYVHLMTARHQILWANGVEAESFYPTTVSMGLIGADDRAALLSLLPGLASDPAVYGALARRSLSGSQTAILRHAAP